jgi:hypothetical protein
MPGSRGESLFDSDCREEKGEENAELMTTTNPTTGY